ncbi:hypothetical protein RFH42_08100 [Acinetobacter rudis]|uniref:hypothetical protein n=1 Tax=Acinetobacter rudis TaxID=632955 RepID=UPI00280CB9A4|nr:hypothetical protein [Acinetobacter rudis]MDQ8952925.1 hypothetical protein [Acinetobacter rudis]
MAMQLQLKSKVSEVKVSAQQKKFQHLKQQIEQQTSVLQQWSQAQQDIQLRVRQEIWPIFDKLRIISLEKIQVLVRQRNKKITKAQLLKLNEKIVQLAQPLIDSKKITEQQNNQLVALLNELGYYGDQNSSRAQVHSSVQHDQHGSSDDLNVAQDSEIEQYLKNELEQLKLLLSDKYELKEDFFDFSYLGLDDFIMKFSRKMKDIEYIEPSHPFAVQEQQLFEREMMREKARVEKKLQQRILARKNANQSMKHIYHRIAAEIHPDREQDEQKKQIKTELLQQVNQAYEAKDLVNLVQFQVEVGQKARPVADQLIRSHNITLELQLEQIEAKITHLIQSFNWDEQISASKKQRKIEDVYAQHERKKAQLKQLLEQEKMILAHFKDFSALQDLMKNQSIWHIC